MGTHMKTTIDIADHLLREAKALASRRGTTLRVIVEEALEARLRGPEPAPFSLRDASVGGRGAPGWFELSDGERTARMYGDAG